MIMVPAPSLYLVAVLYHNTQKVLWKGKNKGQEMYLCMQMRYKPKVSSLDYMYS